LNLFHSLTPPTPAFSQVHFSFSNRAMQTGNLDCVCIVEVFHLVHYFVWSSGKSSPGVKQHSATIYIYIYIYIYNPAGDKPLRPPYSPSSHSKTSPGSHAPSQKSPESACSRHPGSSNIQALGREGGFQTAQDVSRVRGAGLLRGPSRVSAALPGAGPLWLRGGPPNFSVF
jgi:hypothetical protein